MKRKNFNVTSTQPGCYGDERKVLGKEFRKEVLGDPTAFLQINLGTHEGKPLGVRIKANQVGFKTLATIEKNLKSGARIAFHEEVEIKRTVSTRTGEALDSYTLDTALVDDEGKMTFDVVSTGPTLVMPEGWAEDDEVEAIQKYSVRANNAGSDAKDDTTDVVKLLGAAAGM